MRTFPGILLLIIPLISFATDTTLFPEVNSWEITDIKVWGPHNLYTPIDGAADMFLSYHFEEMQSAIYTRDSNYIRVEVYRHSTPVDAFGAYSREKPQRGDIYIELGTEGYTEDEYINYLAGRYYVKITSWHPAYETRYAMHDIAYRQAELLNVDFSPLPLIFCCFPSEGLIPHSQKYINENVLGYSFFTSSFEMDYTDGDNRYTLFILSTDHDSVAADMLKSYHEYLNLPFNEYDSFFSVNDPYTGSVFILPYNKYLICARGSVDETVSRMLLPAMRNKITDLMEKP